MKLVLSVFLLSTTPALAAPLMLGEALTRVETSHPWFRTRESTAALAQARQDAAQAAPPAEVSLHVENFLGTGELSGAKSAETTLQFSRALDWAERRAGRREAAASLSEAERAAWEERRRELLAETARRFIRVAATQSELELAREHAALAARTVESVQERASRAAANTSDMARARLAKTEAELAAEHAEHLLLSARQGLASLWGAAAADFESAAGDFSVLPRAASYEQLAPRLAATPAQARLAAQVRWRQAQEKLALLSASRGESRWAAGLRRVEVSDDFGFVAGINYAWPATAAGRAQAAESRVDRERDEAEGASALLEARSVLYGLCQELTHARLEHDAARDEMLPAAQEWLAAVETGVAAGRYGMRELLEARTALFEAKCRQLAAAADYQTTLVAIEQMLGGAATL